MLATAQQALRPPAASMRVTMFAGLEHGVLTRPAAKQNTRQPLFFEVVGLKPNRTYGTRVRITGKKKPSHKKCCVHTELSDKTSAAGRLTDAWDPAPKKWCKGRTCRWELLRFSGKEGEPYIAYHGKRRCSRAPPSRSPASHGRLGECARAGAARPTAIP